MWLSWLLLLTMASAMQLDMSKVRKSDLISVTIVQERLMDTWTVKLDPRDTLIRLYALVSAASGFDDSQFSLYLDETSLESNPTTIEAAGIIDRDYLLLKVLPSSPIEPIEHPLRKVASADTLLFSPRLRRSHPNLRTKSRSAGAEHCRTPRKRVNKSRVECFYHFPADQQEIIRNAFYEDIIRNENLTIMLERKYPELIETMFTELPKFYEMLTPELMVEIDEIEEGLRASGQFIEVGALESISEESGEEAPGFVAEVLHIMAMINGHEIPILLDCMVTDTTSTPLCIVIL